MIHQYDMEAVAKRAERVTTHMLRIDAKIKRLHQQRKHCVSSIKKCKRILGKEQCNAITERVISKMAKDSSME